jgi:ABC-type sugar transport system permease subunit
LRGLKKRWWAPWAFLALPLIMYTLWVIAPIVQTLFMSFTKWDGMSQAEFVGFQNFQDLFGNKTFWTSLKNNLYWLILFVGIPVPIGLLVAMLFDMKLPGNKLFKTLFYLSMTLSFVVIAQIWSWIFEPRSGVMTSFFQALGFENLAQVQQAVVDLLLYVGIPLAVGFLVGWIINSKLEIQSTKRRWMITLSSLAVCFIISFILYKTAPVLLTPSRLSKRGFPWLSDPNFVTFSLIFASIWRQIPYVMVLYLAGLKGVPPQLIEASIVDGANWGQRFIHVILPMLRPATTVAITISVIDSLRAFDIVYAMTQGGPFNSSSVLANYMYIESFNNYRMGYGSAIAVVQFVITLGFIIIYLNNVIKQEEK